MTEAATFELTDAVRSVAEKARSRVLCDECRGRLVGRWGHGLTNSERARALAGGGIVPTPSAPGPCSICGGLFDRLDLWADRAAEAARAVEWHRFTCGSRWDPEALATEEFVWTEVGTSWGESARTAFNRELGKRIEARTGASGGTETPDVVLLADLPVGRVEVTVLPTYIRGRYRKLDRELPQTRWPCRRCKGRGCVTCGGTGKTFLESVEELVAAPFVRASGAEGTRFHGMGREDRDARMLGSGRPFVLELLRPKRRTIDLGAAAAEVGPGSKGRVEIDEVVSAGAADVVAVKEAAPEKSYRVGVVGAVGLARVKEALSLVLDRSIAQRTPTRVAHRRSDRVRTRRIVAAHVVEASEGRFTIELRAEAGTYVKEWVEGDGGRTEPNLAELVGVPLTVEYLDVVAIHDREP